MTYFPLQLSGGTEYNYTQPWSSMSPWIQKSNLFIDDFHGKEAAKRQTEGTKEKGKKGM